jgi:hypothetical protein
VNIASTSDRDFDNHRVPVQYLLSGELIPF